MKLMKRTVSVFLAILMLLGSFSVLASATVVDGYGDTITFDIKFYRNTGTEDAPVWTETTKAAPGESIRARFFIDTDYVFGASTIFFLYDKNAIVMDTTNYVQPSLGYTIVGNTEAGTVVGDNNISGEFTFSTSQTGIGDDLVYYEILPEGTFDDYGFAYFAFNSGKAAALSGDEWAFELHYNVAETPSEKAQIYMPAETVVLPSGDDNNWDAAATVLGRNHEDDVGGSLVSAGFQESYDWDVDPVIVNNDQDADSTLTFKSKITFDANGGTLTGDATSEGYIKAAATAPAVTAPAGSEFLGWVPSTVENPTEDDVVTTFAYDYADTTYTALYKTTAAETSAYTVNVYEMDVDGNYPTAPTVVPDTTDVVGEEVIYTPTIEEGFYLDSKSTPDLKTTVTTDDTDVIDVYLARKAQTVKYVDENGNAIDGLADAKYYYGKTYNVAAEVVKTGYKWAGWTADGATVTAGSEVTAKPAADGEVVTYKAAYTADANTVTIQGVYSDAKLGGDVELAPYTVNTTTGYTVKVVDAVPEETEDNVTYVLKSALPTAEHYQIPAGEYEIAVADDGNAVLEITYEAKSYTYAFVDEDGSVIETDTVPYYTVVEAPEGEDKPEVGKLFKNWVSGSDTLNSFDTFNIDADVTYTAAYDDEIFYVYYTVEGDWPDGFEQIEDKEITYDDEVVLPVVDDVPGYTFSGWEVSGATKNDEGKWIAGASDVDVTATWTHDEYTIAFYLDETSTEPYASDVLYYDDPIEAPTPDQSEILGQKFLGWTYEDETGADLGEITKMPEKNVVAYLSAEPYVVTFYDIYGLDVAAELSKATITAEDAANAEAIVNEIKDIDDIDFTFVEWRDADGNAVKFPFDVTSNVEIYPYATVTVDFYKEYDDEGNPVDLYKSYTKDFGYTYTDYATDFADLGTPTKEGHSFADWDVLLQGEAYTNETVVATWNVEKYQLSFTIDGEVVDGYPVETAYGTVIAAPDAGEKAGYTFSGWNGIPADGKMPANDLTVTGTWVADGNTAYTIETYTMDTNGAYGDPAVETKTAATGTVINYTVPEAGEGLYIDTEKCVLNTTVSAGNDDVIKVYYGRNKYAVTLDGVAGEVFHGAVYNVPAAPEATEGKEFTGWSDGTTTYQPADTITISGPITLTSQWKDLAYTVEFEDYAGTVIYTVENVTHGSTLTAEQIAAAEAALPSLEGEGYKFIGWEEDVTAPITKDTRFSSDKAKETYIIKFETGYDDITVEDLTVTYGEDISGKISQISKDNINFQNWVEDLATLEPIATTVEDLGNDGASVTYYAYWTANITFVDGDATETKTLAKDENILANAPAFADKGEDYEAGAWYTAADAAGDKLAADAVVTGNATYYAYYAPKTDITYTVEIYEEKLTADKVDGESEYALAETITVENATAGTSALYNADREGFTFENNDPAAPVVASGLVVKAYYARNTVTITVNDKEETFEYGEEFNPEVPDTTEGQEFDKWVDENGDEVKVPTTITEDMDGLVVEATYKYVITFIGFGGSTVKNDAQPEGELIVAPEASTEAEYEFKGWYTEADGKGDKLNTATDKVTGAATYYAYYVANEYEVVFKINNNIYASTKAAFGTDVTDPGTPGIDVIPAGYTFEGWSEDGKTVLTDLGTVKAGGNTYLAVLKASENTPYEIVKYFQTVDGQGWSEAQVTPKTGKTGDIASVDYDAEAVEGFRIDETISKNNVEITGDGNAKVIIYYLRNTVNVTINGETKEYFYGAEVEEPAAPSKEGYTFGDAWTYADGTPATFPIEVTGDITLVPVFTVNKYTITFVDGATTLEGPTEVEYGSTIVAPTAPDKTSEGLVFGGWLDADTGAAMPEKMPAKNATYKANYVQNGAPVKYTIEVYQMNLAGNYELTAKTKASALVGTTQTVEAGEVTGFTFSAADSVLSAEILADGSTTLKVCYARNKYTVTFGANAPVEVYYGATIPVADAPDAATGMVFAGWSPEVPAAMPAENLVFEATWDVAEFTITYVINGEAKAPITYAYGADVETPETPNVPGMKFVKWTPEVPATMPAENLIIVAEFEASVYNVTFRNADGTVFDKKAVQYGDEITLPTTEPTLEHHTFAGWSGIPADGLMPDSDLEVTPIFERVKVMLVPKAGSTTVIDRDGLTVDDYVDGESTWYVYGLEEILKETTLRENFIDVTGDGRIEIVYRELANGKTFAPYTGTGTVINVYDNVTGELVESFTIIIFGDLNGDSFIQAIDASIAEDEVLMNTDWSDEYSDNYTEYMLIAADFDKNGVIKAADTANIENTALGITIIDQTDGSVM